MDAVSFFCFFSISALPAFPSNLRPFDRSTASVSPPPGHGEQTADFPFLFFSAVEGRPALPPPPPRRAACAVPPLPPPHVCPSEAPEETAGGRVKPAIQSHVPRSGFLQRGSGIRLVRGALPENGGMGTGHKLQPPPPPFSFLSTQQGAAYMHSAASLLYRQKFVQSAQGAVSAPC